jgi:hypothetical protein
LQPTSTPRPPWFSGTSRNPLTGLSGLQLGGRLRPGLGRFLMRSQSPYGAKRFATEKERGWPHIGYHYVSQSPYGAKRFATWGVLTCPFSLVLLVAIPLRGYVVCNGPGWRRRPRGCSSGRNPLTGLRDLQLRDCGSDQLPPCEVAIPLRGYVVCNFTPLRMPFWTAPPERVFVRKMKLGICIGQRVGVLRGLGR